MRVDKKYTTINMNLLHDSHRAHLEQLRQLRSQELEVLDRLQSAPLWFPLHVHAVGGPSAQHNLYPDASHSSTTGTAPFRRQLSKQLRVCSGMSIDTPYVPADDALSGSSSSDIAAAQSAAFTSIAVDSSDGAFFGCRPSRSLAPSGSENDPRPISPLSPLQACAAAAA